ncbi:MAG: TolC family protein, partial [Gammaproteobacteria bacterium]|nr:TolC family protein [Gammaproteobacteria bacterium]
MTNFRKFLSLTVLCITISGFVAGPSAAFELSTLVADSISAHPEVLEKMHLYRQALGDQVIAKSGWRPSIDLEATTGEYSTESPATGNTTIDYDSSRVELSVTQNLFNGFNTTHQLKQTEFRSRAALFDVYDTADNIALDAVQAYFDVLKQRRLYELAIANMSSHEKILAQIREKNSSGVGRRSQLQQTEGRVARAHASLIAQENNLQDSATLLHQILGRYVDPNDLREPVLPKLPEGDLDSLIDRALLNHPAMKVVANNIKASQADYKRSKSSDLPNIDLRLA